MTDEMDLVSKLKDVESLRPEAYERARNALRAAMADPGTLRVKETAVQDNGFSSRRDGRRRVGTGGKVGIGAGIGVAAAAAAIALVATSGTTGSAVPAAAAGSGATTGTASRSPAATQSPLVTLAASIKANDHTAGDASVVIQSQRIGGKTPAAVYQVFADDGAVYSAGSLSGLPAAITPAGNQGGNSYDADLKVAILAANGNLAKARTEMIDNTSNNLGIGLSPAAQKADWAKIDQADKELYKEKDAKGTPPKMTAQRAQELADNYLWTNSFIALSTDNGNPLVREGVLRLLSTISGVSVAHTTTGGKATLTITAGPEVFTGDGSQVVVIDANTGTLLSSVSNSTGIAQSVTTYQVYRVSLAALKAGKLPSVTDGASA
ncbi:MAG TPA: hypothetical protein VK817_27205 [Trebonia sp.]|jgi:hypothetical protein|nr:hypothetical protein [Trebonia sp.]